MVPDQNTYGDLDFADLNAVREDLERTLEEGTEYTAELRSINPYHNEWTDKKGDEQEVFGLEWVFIVVNAENPKDNGFRVSQRTVWDSYAFKRTLIAVATAAGRTENIKISYSAAMEGEDEFFNELADLTPTVQFIAGLESWKDKDTGDKRSRTRIAKFVD